MRLAETVLCLTSNHFKHHPPQTFPGFSNAGKVIFVFANLLHLCFSSSKTYLPFLLCFSSLVFSSRPRLGLRSRCARGVGFPSLPSVSATMQRPIKVRKVRRHRSRCQFQNAAAAIRPNRREKFIDSFCKVMIDVSYILVHVRQRVGRWVKVHDYCPVGTPWHLYTIACLEETYNPYSLWHNSTHGVNQETAFKEMMIEYFDRLW